MPDGSPTLTLTLHPRIAEIAPADWDACAGAGQPVRQPRLSERAGGQRLGRRRTGWLPQHAVLRDGAGRVVAVAPMYAKSHSYGEYVFDHGWAHALERAGGNYYPKLQVAVPFSPVPGPRLLCRPDGSGGGRRARPRRWPRPAGELRLSSVHVTFCTEAGWRGAGRGRLAAAPRHAVPLGE